jgi:hypothetical protein
MVVALRWHQPPHSVRRSRPQYRSQRKQRSLLMSNHVYLGTGAVVNNTGFGSARVVPRLAGTCAVQHEPFLGRRLSIAPAVLVRCDVVAASGRRGVRRSGRSRLDGIDDAMRDLDIIAVGNGKNVYANG